MKGTKIMMKVMRTRMSMKIPVMRMKAIMMRLDMKMKKITMKTTGEEEEVVEEDLHQEKGEVHPHAVEEIIQDGDLPAWILKTGAGYQGWVEKQLQGHMAG